jgi:uncharacterized coiled-coil protein SlyX
VRAFVLIPLVLACFALSPQARATCQQGCLTGDNTALGEDALINATGPTNTAIGFNALVSDTTGNGNMAAGALALFSNTTGAGNTASGENALLNNVTGGGNTAIGFNALGDSNSGSNNIALGNAAGVNIISGDNNIDIGSFGSHSDSGVIRIGSRPLNTKVFITGISTVTVAGGVGVVVNTAGQLGTVTSSARFKEAIKPMDKASETILALKPVTFRYKHDLDPEGIQQFGLVAEDVEKVNPDLVARDDDGQPYTVRYEAVNAMLLNEFLKEHCEVQELKSTAAKQEATIAEFKKEIANLTATIKQQSAQIQKVSAQIEVSKAASKTVLNDQ